MKTFYVEVDTSDGACIGNIVEVEDETAKKFEPLIEKIKKYGDAGYDNFPYGECAEEEDLCERYNVSEDELKEFQKAFRLYGIGYGFRTITKIQEVTLGKVWL